MQEKGQPARLRRSQQRRWRLSGLRVQQRVARCRVRSISSRRTRCANLASTSAGPRTNSWSPAATRASASEDRVRLAPAPAATTSRALWLRMRIASWLSPTRGEPCATTTWAVTTPGRFNSPNALWSPALSATVHWFDRARRSRRSPDFRVSGRGVRGRVSRSTASSRARAERSCGSSVDIGLSVGTRSSKTRQGARR